MKVKLSNFKKTIRRMMEDIDKVRRANSGYSEEKPEIDGEYETAYKEALEMDKEEIEDESWSRTKRANMGYGEEESEIDGDYHDPQFEARIRKVIKRL